MAIMQIPGSPTSLGTSDPVFLRKKKVWEKRIDAEKKAFEKSHQKSMESHKVSLADFCDETRAHDAKTEDLERQMEEDLYPNVDHNLIKSAKDQHKKMKAYKCKWIEDGARDKGISLQKFIKHEKWDKKLREECSAPLGLAFETHEDIVQLKEMLNDPNQTIEVSPGSMTWVEDRKNPTVTMSDWVAPNSTTQAEKQKSFDEHCEKVRASEMNDSNRTIANYPQMSKPKNMTVEYLQELDKFKRKYMTVEYLQELDKFKRKYGENIYVKIIRAGYDTKYSRTYHRLVFIISGGNQTWGVTSEYVVHDVIKEQTEYGQLYCHKVILKCLITGREQTITLGTGGQRYHNLDEPGVVKGYGTSQSPGIQYGDMSAIYDDKDYEYAPNGTRIPTMPFKNPRGTYYDPSIQDSLSAQNKRDYTSYENYTKSIPKDPLKVLWGEIDNWCSGAYEKLLSSAQSNKHSL